MFKNMAATENVDISSKEFQRQLFDWFEKRGLLSELRTFMRHRMISALYSTEAPCPGLRCTSDMSVSPTLQALLLLIVEFLVKQEYHYTMSIFVAEAPLIASFPKLSGYVSYVPQYDKLKSGAEFPRYSEKDVQGIMEVFGITTGSEGMNHILRLYSNNNAREPLLVCALTALSAIVENCTEKGDKSLDNSTYQLKEETYNTTYWIEEIRLVLLRAKLTSHQLQQVEELLRKLQAETANSVRKIENEKHNKLIHIQEQKLMAEALLHEEKIRAQHLAAEEDLKNKQKHLEQVTFQLRQQHDLVLDRLSRVQRHADQIKQQENDLIKKETLLEKNMKGLEEEQRSLAGLRIELQEAAHFLRQEHSDTKTILELNRLQERCLQLEHELRDTKEQLHTSVFSRTDVGIQTVEKSEEISPNIPEKNYKDRDVTTEIKVHTSVESSSSSSNEKENTNQVCLLKRVLSRLQQENSELKAIAAQQRKRIDELTTKAAELANHIAEKTETSSPLPVERPLNKVPQSQQQLLEPLHTSHSHHSGSGPWYPSAAFSRAAHTQGKDVRKRHSKRYNLNHSVSLTTSLSSDDSPTEEVLREARNRLQKLEEESEAVDRSYRDFRARQADVTITTSVPSQPTPVNIVRHPTYSTTGGLFTRSSPPIATSFLQSRGFSIPSVQGFSSGSTSLRLSSSRFTGFPARPRSQFTLPEQNRHSFQRSENIFPKRESVPSSAQSFSLLKQKLDTLQIGSHQNLPMVDSVHNSSPQEEMETEKNSKIGQSESHIIFMQEENINSNVVKASDDILRPSLSPEKELSSEKVNSQKEKNATSGKNENSTSENQALENVTRSPHNTETVNSNIDNKGEDPLILNSKSFLLVNERGNSPPASPLQHTAVESSEILPVKSNVIDTTLNEISTYSSSPASAIVVSESKAIPKTAAISDPAVVDIQRTKELNYIREESSQLLNTSLSSIENGNLQVSGGSNDKRSDEDDDFW